MNQVNETSRLTQLTPAGLAKYSDLMIEHKILGWDLISEIESKIDSLDSETLAKSLAWYAEANDFARKLADEFDTTVEIAAGVIAAISPRMPWLRNKMCAWYVFQDSINWDGLTAAKAATKLGKGLVSNFAMAIKIVRGEPIEDVLTGTKRRSFYNNIVSPHSGDSVTIDTWMVRAFMNTINVDLRTATEFLRKSQIALGGTGFGYFALAEACRVVAKRKGMIASQAQAAYWISVSGSFNGGRIDISK